MEEYTEDNMNDHSDVLLSICIPTYKRPDTIRQLMKSILSQDADPKCYEIRITDNSETDETKDVIEEYSGIENLYYKKTDCKGFYNSWEALKSGKGSLLKLHNDYSIFKPGTLQKMIDAVRREEHDKAQIFFSLGSLEGTPQRSEFSDYNSFMDCITIQATWSSAFAIWKEDFDSITEKGIVPDTMYPHTSFLHRVTEKKRYVVDNYPYVQNIEPKKKGGYNLIDNFVRIYLTMVKNELSGPEMITQETYRKIEKDILAFCADWYYTTKENPDKYTFKFDNAEEIIKSVCGENAIKEYRSCLRKRKIKHYKMNIKKTIMRNVSHIGENGQ